MTLKVRLTVAASFFLVALVFLIFSPTWSKNNNILDDTVDWSQVVDDPDVHMTFNLLMLRDARWSADALQKDDAFAKKILEKRFNVTLNYDLISPSVYERKGALVKASGSIPDIFTEFSGQLSSTIIR